MSSDELILDFVVPDFSEAPAPEESFDGFSEEIRAEIEPPAPVKPAGAFELRDYQEGSVQSIRHDLKRHRSTLLVLATGCGKTVVFSQVALEEVQKPKGKVLIIAHTEELLDQAADKLEKTTGLTSGREKAKDEASPFDRVVIASVQTLGKQKRLENWAKDHFSLIIIDEAHRSLAASYRRIIDYFESAKVLGVTATADRGDQKSLGRIYDTVAFEYGLLEACRDGYLVRPIARTIPLKIDLSGIIAKRGRTGDYDAMEIADKIEPFLLEIAKHFKTLEEEKPRRTVVFLPSVDTAMMLCDALMSVGITADFVSGDKERCPNRATRIKKFTRGETQFLCNAMLLTEGFDDPGIARVCILRPTKIRGLYVQCVGRGTRTLPGTIDGITDKQERIKAIAQSAKPNLEIVDFLWLTEKLDLIKPANIVSGDPQIVERMQAKERDGDLIDQEEEADRDLLEYLKKEAQKNSNKPGKTFDPLAKATVLDEQDLLNFDPKKEGPFATQPPTKEQNELLVKNGIDPARVLYRGLAARWIKTIETRKKAGLCSPKQADFLSRMGVKSPHLYTKEDATKMIGRKITKFKKR